MVSLGIIFYFCLYKTQEKIKNMFVFYYGSKGGIVFEGLSVYLPVSVSSCWASIYVHNFAFGLRCLCIKPCCSRRFGREVQELVQVF